jgi:hypothetical protein
MHGDGGGGGGFGGGHSGGHGGSVSHHPHGHHPDGHHSSGQQRGDAQFFAYGADTEARHRRARSPASTVARWVLLAAVLIIMLLIVVEAH